MKIKTIYVKTAVQLTTYKDRCHKDYKEKRYFDEHN